MDTIVLKLKDSITWKELEVKFDIEQFLTGSGFPAAIIWNTHGFDCSPTELRDQHINVP